jgi:aminoglycoside phosphotransferase family enzyme
VHPGRPAEVVAIETHYAWVFLAGERAYKLKKPVRVDRMDHRSLARRERACREELRLNRRLAPSVYLGVIPLVITRDGHLSRRADGRVVDWLVEMVRLPDARMLDRAIRDDTLGERDVGRVMARLAGFFRHARRLPTSDLAYRARLSRQILGNARELSAPDLALDSQRVDAVVQGELAFLDRDRAVLAGRGARLLDGHGDLRPEHIFLGTRTCAACVIDCVEFDAELRRLDPAEEIAFLALECAQLGARRLAAALPGRYARATGDPAPPALMQFYMARRAAVRAKIAAWHLRDPALAGQARKWRARAHSYLDEAARHLHEARALVRRVVSGV